MEISNIYHFLIHLLYYPNPNLMEISYPSSLMVNQKSKPYTHDGVEINDHGMITTILDIIYEVIISLNIVLEVASNFQEIYFQSNMK